MKTSLVLSILFLALASASVLDYVNSYIGTGGDMFSYGAVPVGPQRPFAMVRLGPDSVNVLNYLIPWQHFAGYFYNDTVIRCFSHTHFLGGVVDWGNVGMMPISADPTKDIVTDYGFRSKFQKKNEEAHPHFYNVHLDTWNIFVELTATRYTGIHRYTWKDPSKPRVIMFYVSQALHARGCRDSNVFVDANAQTITGSILNYGALTARIGGSRVYFYVTFKSRFTSHGLWDTGKIIPNGIRLNGTDIGAYLKFDDAQVEMHVGISFQSVEKAKLNLENDVGAKRFDDVKKESETVWLRELNTIQIKTDNHDDKVKFYSALYHSLIVPTTFSESDKTYLGFDNKIHRVDNGSDAFYSELSLWDTFRTQVPFLTMHKPEVARDTVRSLINMLNQGGDLPRWPIANGYGGSMIGQHADIVIADAWFKGVKDFDIRRAYWGMRKGAMEPQRHAGRTGLESYNTKGFITNDIHRKGCSLVVEYAHDDWAIANIAKELGLTEDEVLFRNRSMNYKNHYDKGEKYCCSREKDGTFDCPYVKTNIFDPRYIEGDAWHYRFYAPHDPEGLINVIGGKDAFIKELDTFFTKAHDFPWNELPNPYYWAGNEHNLFSVWLFNWAGRPDLTQKHSRWIMDNRYLNKPWGLDGNDDYGTLSAWFLFTSMSFYPSAGSDLYIIGSPLFDSIEYRHAKGLLTIIAHNNSKTNVFVERSTINGTPFSLFLKHDQLFGGNVRIEYWMTNKNAFETK
jgi:predicted alpha-1,2-mannosidase